MIGRRGSAALSGDSMADMGKALIILGLLIFVGAVAWWYLYFEQFLGAEVKQASACFYYFKEDCLPSAFERLLQASDIPIYSPYALWTAAALLGLGTILLAVAPFRR